MLDLTKKINSLLTKILNVKVTSDDIEDLQLLDAGNVNMASAMLGYIYLNPEFKMLDHQKGLSYLYKASLNANEECLNFIAYTFKKFELSVNKELQQIKVIADKLDVDEFEKTLLNK